jgi:hypothetical protein
MYVHSSRITRQIIYSGILFVKEKIFICKNVYIAININTDFCYPAFIKQCDTPNTKGGRGNDHNGTHHHGTQLERPHANERETGSGDSGGAGHHIKAEMIARGTDEMME